MGHPRRCICTNALRGLSAIVEFLVKVSTKTFGFLFIYTGMSVMDA